MRDLHVVALSEDGRHVVLATTPDASKGGFRVALDDRLVSAVRGDLPRPGEQEPRELSVREIQARLRAGESVEEIARSAGVPLARVERFAGPVLSERAQVVEAARRAVLVRGRRGPSALSLGEAVDLRLSELPSMRADSVEWTAAKGDDGRWTVEVSWFSRGRTRKAAWFYDVAARTVTSADPGSAALAHVDPSGRRVPLDGDAAPPPRATRPAAAASTAAAAGPSSPAPRSSGSRSTSTGRAAPARRAPARPAARTAPAPVRPAPDARPAPVEQAAPVQQPTAGPRRAASAKGVVVPAPGSAPAAPQRVVAGVVRRGAAPLVGPDTADVARERAAALEADRAAAKAAAVQRREEERAEAQQVQAERAEAQRAERERVAAEKAEAQRVERERVAAEKAEAQRVERERVAAEKAEAQRVERERVQAERAAADKAAPDKAAADKAAADKAAADKAAAAKAEAERAEAERAEAERAAAERAEAGRVEAQRVEAERAAAERAESARVEAERAAAERAEAEAAHAAAEAPSGPPSLRVVPTPVDDPTGKEPAGQQPARPAAKARRGRTAVPSWSDVLLSTAPAQERDED